MKHGIIVLSALIMLGTSCTKETKESCLDISEENQMLMTKLVGGSEGEIVPGNIMVMVDEESADKINNGEWAEVADALLGDIDAISFSPAIPAKPKNIEVARKYGLHQWFSVEFDKQTAPQKIAEKLAASPVVRSVQYNRYISPVRSEQVYPADLNVAMTKAEAEDVPFNDPYLGQQWNLVNNGTVSADAVSGADAGVKDAWRLTGGDPSIIVAVMDCGINDIHEDLRNVLWTNTGEVRGNGIDDDGNGFIDDVNGFNFIGCTAIDEDYISNKIEGKEAGVIKPLYSIDCMKGTGHGTHIAGIIGAQNGNGKGVSSIAGGTGNNDGVRLMSCQIFMGTGLNAQSCSDAQSAAAFIYAADNGACLANCSYGDQNIIRTDDEYLNNSPLENRALRYFLDPANSNHDSLEGNIAVFAAGNHQNPYSIYPGALSYCISVTAFGADFLPGSYTNYGPGCSIAAPGGEYAGGTDYKTMILSTGKGGRTNGVPGVTDINHQYVYMNGTSMACPHVTGVLALGVAYAQKLGKTFTRDEMTSMLLTSVNDIDQYMESGSKYHGKMGTGAVDAWKFLMAIEGTPSVMVKAGAKSVVNLADYCNPDGSYTLTIDDTSRASLGISGDLSVNDGKLEITCSAVGAGKITINGYVGKDPEMENGIGGLAWSREISIVSRPFASSNGGWL